MHLPRTVGASIQFYLLVPLLIWGLEVVLPRERFEAGLMLSMLGTIILAIALRALPVGPNPDDWRSCLTFCRLDPWRRGF